MVCPLCFKSIEKDDTVYLNSYGNTMEPKYLDVEPHKLPRRSGQRLPVREERLITHEGCDCLHPLVSFAGKEAEANTIFQTAERTNADRLKGMVTGVQREWGALSAMTGKHWSFVRMSHLASKHPGIKTMWFPERLFPWVDEEQSFLSIFVRGPRAAGKSVFTTMSGSSNSYSMLGEEVSFQENFGYAVPRNAETPYEDYGLLLKNMNSVQFQSALIKDTSKQSSTVVAAFFSKCLPGSEIDTVMLYDVAGELHEQGLNERTDSMRMDRMYWCIVIAVEDLVAFQFGDKTKGTSVKTALEHIQSAGTQQRIVIAVTKMDTVEWSSPPRVRPDPQAARSVSAAASGRTADDVAAAKAKAKARDKARERAAKIFAVFDKVQALARSKEPIEGKEDDPEAHRDEDREAEHRKTGEQGKNLLYELLDDEDLREVALKRVLKNSSNIRAVFFTGITNWEKPKEDVRPFGIGEAICWMAEDLSGGGGGARGEGAIADLILRLAAWWKRRRGNKKGATTS